VSLRLVPPEGEALARRRPFVRLLAEAAEALGGHLEMETAYAHLGRFVAADGRARPLFGNALGLNSDAAAALAADKDYTARLLAAEGLPAVPGLLVFSPRAVARMRLKNAAVAATLPGTAAAMAHARRHAFPLIIKPNDGSEGRGLARVESFAEFRTDLAALFETDEKVRIEPLHPGTDHRLLVLDGKVRLAYARHPLAIEGDGRRPAAALIADTLARLAAGHRGPRLAAGDPRIARALAAAGIGPQDIPAPGARIPLLANANLSTGGRLEDLSGRLPPGSEALATRAASALGLVLAGVDILAPDLCRGPEGAAILEVNTSPGLDFYAAESPAHWARARALLIEALSL